MKKEVTEKAVLSLLEYADGNQISVVFQGGEPLLAGIEYFRHFVAFLESHNTKKSTVHYSLQTNGTLLNNEWIAFFKQNKFLIGLSLDGTAGTNKFRTDSNGENSFETVVSASKKLSKKGVDYNILTVLTGYLAENCEEVYSFYKEKGYKYLQFIPSLRPFKSCDESELYMTSNQYENFLKKTFNLYCYDFANGDYVSIRYFDNLVRIFSGQQPEQCGTGGFCTRQFVVESNGNVYPCDFYCTDEWLLGNISENSLYEMITSEKEKAFIERSIQYSEKCKSCRFAYLCRAGGCFRQREDFDYCQAYYNFFPDAEKLLKKYFC